VAGANRVSIPGRIRSLRTIAAEANLERLLWAVRVRWLAIGGFSVLALLAWWVGVLPALRSSILAGVASAALNGVNHWCVVRGRGVRAVTVLAIPADVLLITYLIVTTGGTQSPFVMLYVVQVVATAMLVDLLIAAAVALASVVCFLTALSLHAVDAAPGLAMAPQRGADEVVWGLFLLYCLALLTFLGGYIAERLRRSEGSLAERNQHLRGALASLEHTHADLQRTVERLKSTEAQLLRSEKMRALGQFVAGIAHELNNPIGFVASNLEHLRGAVAALTEMLGAYAGAPPTVAASELAARRRALRIDPLLEDLPSVLADCQEGARRAAEIVAALRAFARADHPGQWSRVDLRERLERTVALLRHRLGAGVSVERDYGDVPPVECLAGQLDQVLLNVLANAVDAVEGRGIIHVRTRCEHVPPAAPHAVVSVHDDGAGMSPQVRARIFDPFFTTKPEGRGMGLGLSVSYGIVERHGGTIAVESSPGSGTTFILSLPVQQPGVATNERADAGAEPA
jgi:signal transduction histidine kinase